MSKCVHILPIVSIYAEKYVKKFEKIIQNSTIFNKRLFLIIGFDKLNSLPSNFSLSMFYNDKTI